MRTPRALEGVTGSDYGTRVTYTLVALFSIGLGGCFLWGLIAWAIYGTLSFVIVFSILTVILVVPLASFFAFPKDGK